MTILEGEALLRHGQELARRYAHRVGPEAARDLSAEAVLHALRRPAPDGHMEPWLERIVRNLFIDRLRRAEPTLVDVDEAPLPSAETPEDRTLMAERRRQVRQSLAALPPDLRRALLSRFWGELSDSDAAQRLGVAPATVRTRIHRSLRRLREALAGLRALLPPCLGKAGATVLAPALVAAFVVFPAAPPPPAPTVSQPTAVAVAPQATLPRAELAPASPPPVVARPRPRAKAATAGPVIVPAVQPTTVAVSAPTLDAPRPQVVLSPDTSLIVAVPAFAAPPLVDIPADFGTAFDKMIEDEL